MRINKGATGRHSTGDITSFAYYEVMRLPGFSKDAKIAALFLYMGIDAHEVMSLLGADMLPTFLNRSFG